MGERLEYNAQTKKYDVDVGDLLAEIARLKENQYINVSPRADTPNRIFNLDTDLKGLGMKIFYGNIIVNRPTPHNPGTVLQNGTGIQLPYPCIVKGAPAKLIDIVPVGEVVKAAYSAEEFEGYHDYDFTGYQITTPVEVVQVIYHRSLSFTRTNDLGMGFDGTLIRPTGWGGWVKT